jgi:hypothetical protein
VVARVWDDSVLLIRIKGLSGYNRPKTTSGIGWVDEADARPEILRRQLAVRHRASGIGRTRTTRKYGE